MRPSVIVASNEVYVCTCTSFSAATSVFYRLKKQQLSTVRDIHIHTVIHVVTLTSHDLRNGEVSSSLGHTMRLVITWTSINTAPTSGVMSHIADCPVQWLVCLKANRFLWGEYRMFLTVLYTATVTRRVAKGTLWITVGTLHGAVVVGMIGIAMATVDMVTVRTITIVPSAVLVVFVLVPRNMNSHVHVPVT